MSFFRTQQRKRHLKKYSLSSPNIRRTLLKGGTLLTIALVLHVIAMHVFENLSIADAVWLTLTTITTVGYGDISAVSLAGRLSTIIILFLGGIFILAETAGHVFSYFTQQQTRKNKGHWRWNMSNHILIMNTPNNNGEEYFMRLIKQFRETNEYKDHPVQIITRHYPQGLPSSLQSLEGVVHYNGSPDEVESLDAANVTQADLIIVLSKDDSNKSSDGRTFDILHRLKELNVTAQILAECVDDNNRSRLIEAGANRVIRPIRAYPEMIVRSFVAPGSEQIIENMFTSQNDEYKRYNIQIKADNWSDIVCKLSLKNLGTAIGYIEKSTDNLICNPPSDTPVNTDALFVMVRESAIPDLSTIKEVLLSE